MYVLVFKDKEILSNINLKVHKNSKIWINWKNLDQENS